MKKKKLNKKKAVLWSAVLILINMVLSNLLYMNPIVANINKQFEGHVSIKSFDFAGGLVNWIILTMVFGIILMILWIFLYNLFYSCLPGKNWQKGLVFGIIMAVIKAVPEAFNQFMVINYPIPLILVQLFNTIISTVIFGTLLGVFFYIFKVIEEE